MAIRLMRCRLPPENMLKKSSTPPWVRWKSALSETGSMPGSGTKDSSRNTISAPSVNHSRFLRSVALEKLPRLMEEAICSAEDAMGGFDLRKIEKAAGTLKRLPAASYSDRFQLVSLHRRQGSSGVLALLHAVLLRL